MVPASGPPWPPWPPKNLSKKSWNGVSSSPLPCSWSGSGRTERRRCGFLMVDSVLMFTTLGSSCLEIWEKAAESCCGAGMVSGVASDDFCPSLPFTPEETTVPIRIPTVSVARIVKVYAQRLALRRTQKALSRESISYLLKLPSLLLYLRPRQASSKGSKSLDAEKAVGVNHRLPGAK